MAPAKEYVAPRWLQRKFQCRVGSVAAMHIWGRKEVRSLIAPDKGPEEVLFEERRRSSSPP